MVWNPAVGRQVRRPASVKPGIYYLPFSGSIIINEQPHRADSLPIRFRSGFCSLHTFASTGLPVPSLSLCFRKHALLRFHIPSYAHCFPLSSKQAPHGAPPGRLLCPHTSCGIPDIQLSRYKCRLSGCRSGIIHRFFQGLSACKARRHILACCSA